MKTPHRRQFALLVLVWVTLLFVGTTGCQTASGGAAPAGCGSNNLTYTVDGDDNTNASPVALPPTIAKAVDGIDTRQTFLEVASGSSSLSSPEGISDTLWATSSGEEIIATLHTYIIDNACGTVALTTLDDAVVDTQEADADSNCLVSFTITSNLADTSLKLYNLGTGTTVNSSGYIEGDVSPPTGIVVHAPVETLNEDYTLSVTSVLDTDNSDTSFAATVQSRPVTYLLDSNDEFQSFVFTVTDADGAEAFWKYDRGNSIPQALSTVVELPRTIEQTYGLGDFFYFVDDDFNLFSLDDEGTKTQVSLSDMLQSSKTKVKAHPSGTYLAYATNDINNSFLGVDTASIGIYDILTDTDLGVLDFDNQSTPFTELSFDWANSCELVIITYAESGAYRFYTANVCDFLEDNTADVSLTEKFSRVSYMGEPVSDHGVNGYIYYACLTGSTTQICEYDTNTETRSIVESLNVVANSIRFSPDRQSYITYQLSPLDTTLPEMVARYSISLTPGRGRTAYLTVGEKPEVVENGFIAYIATTYDDSVQLGYLHDRQFTGIEQDALSITPASSLVAAGDSVSFLTSGGVAPYTYSISGNGTMNSYTGHFTASSTAGSTTVTVTDFDGETTSTTITVPSSGTVKTTFATASSGNFADFGSLVNNDGDINDMVLQSDGKIVVTGVGSNGSDDDIMVMRVNADGTIDSNFGTNGITLIDVNGENDAGNAVKLQSDGKIVIAGQAQDSGTNKATLVRLNSDGSIDTDFGTSGTVQENLGSGASTYEDVEILSNSNIYVTAQVYFGVTRKYDFAIGKYDSTGTLDTDFGATSGFTYVDFASSQDYAFAMAYDSTNQKFYLGGMSQNSGIYNYALVKFSAVTGLADSGFGTSGEKRDVIGSASNRIYDLQVLSSGKVVAIGSSRDSGEQLDFSMAQYNTDGSLDTSFGDSGTKLFSTSSDPAEAYQFVIQSDGKYVLIGSSHNTASDFALLRVNTDGSVDTSYGTSGIINTSVNDTHDMARAVVILSDNSIVVGGQTDVSGNDHIGVISYWP